VSNKDRMSDSEASQIEDYGTEDATDSGYIADDMSSGGNSNMVGAEGSGNADISSGSSGSEGGQGSERGEMFGEFGNTGTGTDLTLQMESNDIDPRSGLVKGGAAGEDEIAGLGQYGGETGGVTGQDG
jgi:hypothetical protein